MASNYVVRDMVHHIHDEREYRAGRSLSYTLLNLKKNLWIFFVILLFSSGLGYVAVVLPDAVESRKSSALRTLGEYGDMKDKFDGLSDEEKAELMKRFGGMTP